MSDGEQIEEEKVGTVEVDMDDARNLDENVFKENNNIIDEGTEAEFSCTAPRNEGGHMVYLCKGVDS